jgi:septal ring factor EnvC (AmiA/AmiB activator)
MLQQMAEALEDEAAGLYRRAATYEAEDFQLNCEIKERQTEISRLQFRLEACRSDRDALLEKIDAIRNEAAALREEAFDNEEDLALAAIHTPRAKDSIGAAEPEIKQSFSDGGNAPESSLYFRPMSQADAR